MFEYYNNLERQCFSCRKWFAQDKTKKWFDETYCLECWIKDADAIYLDNGKNYKPIPKKVFTN